MSKQKASKLAIEIASIKKQLAENINFKVAGDVFEAKATITKDVIDTRRKSHSSKVVIGPKKYKKLSDFIKDIAEEFFTVKVIGRHKGIDDSWAEINIENGVIELELEHGWLYEGLGHLTQTNTHKLEIEVNKGWSPLSPQNLSQSQTLLKQLASKYIGWSL